MELIVPVQEGPQPQSPAEEQHDTKKQLWSSQSAAVGILQSTADVIHPLLKIQLHTQDKYNYVRMTVEQH